MRRATATVVTLFAGLWWPVALMAHVGAQARLEFEAPGPTSGTSCGVLVRFHPAQILADELHNGHVRLVADMTGHAMPPVEIDLRMTDTPGSFRGDIAFTMPGAWRITLRAEGATEVLVGTTSVDVGDTPGESVTTMLALTDELLDTSSADAPLRYSPWTVLVGACALAGALEAAAVIRKIVALRRGRRPEPGAASRHA